MGKEITKAGNGLHSVLQYSQTFNKLKGSKHDWLKVLERFGLHNSLKMICAHFEMRKQQTKLLLIPETSFQEINKR